jgi:hypothetical protein
MDSERRARIVREAEKRERDQMLADIAALKAQVRELTLLLFDVLDQTGAKTRPVKLLRHVERP